MSTSRLVVREVGYVLACLMAAVTLVAAGYAHEVVGRVAATGAGIAINGSPSVGAMNILVMGLESRTNYEGQPLSVQQLVETHSGNEQSVSSGRVGAQDTDTLILIHISAGALTTLGYQAGTVANASAQSQTPHPGSQVFYGDGASANAAKIAARFGTTATALTSLPAGHVEVLLGSAVTAVPASLTTPGAPAPSSTAGADNGATGGAVTVPANAKFGIPCVY